ncbi:MAG: DUF72 domain-containing protein [Chloroflexi bacterium]|nr:MAG: DUF72 domain-containing protein [Chloroflexota bacterium]
MVDWYLGTIGFSYPEWKNSFYPAGLPANQALYYYSRIFNAVEVNTTFYGPQSPTQIERWNAATPDDFRFCMKAPKRITHELRLKDSSPEMRAFIDASAGLGSKFGAVLVQLPPSFTIGERPTLETFLQTLPSGQRYAIEFRHASWFIPETGALLKQYGVGWVSNDYEELPVELHKTTDFLYIRWIARHNVIPHPGHEVLDRTERLQSWLQMIKANLEGASTVFGFFDNDYAGHAPATCNRLKAMAGLPVVSSSAEEQGRLF